MDEYTQAIVLDAELVREAIAEGVIPGKDHLKRLADLLADARIRYDKAQAEADEEKKSYDVIEATLFDALEAAGLESIRTERGLFRLNDLAWAKLEDAEAAKAWADAHMPELLTLNNARLSKVVRDALRGEVPIEGAVEGTGLMPGVGYTTSRKVTWRRQ
jgi:hypothetical protein